MEDPMDHPDWWKEKKQKAGSPLAKASKDETFCDMEVSEDVPALPSWATVDPNRLGNDIEPHAVQNCVNGQWVETEKHMNIPHPLDKHKFDIFSIPDTQVKELEPFINSLKAVPKSGVHNPLKNNDRYIKFGEISRKVSFSRGLCQLWKPL